MEFVQEGTKDYSEDQDEDDHREGTRETSNFFPNCSDYSSKYTHPWLHDAQDSSPSSSSSRSANYNQLMDLSLGGSREQDGGDAVAVAVEREHMFDKVVTPSDVGKLNRLVIPKQHAERYFPLDSTTNDKGLLLNFEDRTGKPWRFRYSYWNSSQSYVMTKGWSRFVKEKKLDAGDIVSFHRGLGDHAKDRLFIDWRRRPQNPLPTSLRWASARLYSLPQPLMPLPPHHYPHLPPPHLNYNPNPNPNYHYHHPYHRQFQHHPHLPDYLINSAPEPVYYLRSDQMPQSAGHVPMVIDSVPLLHGRTTAAGKSKLRLFGVNMECDKAADEDDLNRRVVLPSTAVLPHVSVSATTSMSPQFSEKGKSSLSFDLDL